MPSFSISVVSVNSCFGHPSFQFVLAAFSISWFYFPLTFATRQVSLEPIVNDFLFHVSMPTLCRRRLVASVFLLITAVQPSGQSCFVFLILRRSRSTEATSPQEAGSVERADVSTLFEGRAALIPGMRTCLLTAVKMWEKTCS